MKIPRLNMLVFDMYKVNPSETRLVWFIRSECHGAPVIVVDSVIMDQYVVRCGQCIGIIDVATREGIWELDRDPTLWTAQCPLNRWLDSGHRLCGEERKR